MVRTNRKNVKQSQKCQSCRTISAMLSPRKTSRALIRSLTGTPPPVAGAASPSSAGGVRALALIAVSRGLAEMESSGADWPGCSEAGTTRVK